MLILFFILFLRLGDRP